MLLKIRLTKFNIIFIFICLLLFSTAIHFFPIWSKGHPFSICTENLVVAKNLYLTGKYSIKNSKDILLSSTLIKSQGIPASTENKLTPLIYAKIFKIFGFNPWLPTKISILFYSLTGLILFTLAWRLFNLKLGLIFGLIFIFTPHISAYSVTGGSYEFALFFVSLALLFYFWDWKIHSKNWRTYFRLGLSSIFFALAFLCRNAFLLSFVPFVIYDFYKTKSLKRVTVFIIPFVILAGAVLIPDFLAGYPHKYLGKYIGQKAEMFGWDGHCFPDPYTYYFEREEYVNKVRDTARGDVASHLLKYGHKLSFKSKVLIYIDSIKYYIKKFFRLITFGGPIMIAFMFVGLFYLFKQRRNLFNLFTFWLTFWFLVLIYKKTSNYNHFLEVSFPLILLSSLGIYQFFKYLNTTLSISQNKKYLFISFLFITILAHLIIANKWAFHERYNTSKIDKVLSFVKAIEKEQLSITDVVAINIHPSFMEELNYFTDKNFIYFSSETIENLLDKNKLQYAFNKFGVTKIIGYDKDLTTRIIQTTEVEDIKLIP